MIIRPTRIFPLGDNAVTVEFGNEMSVEINRAALSLANHFTAHPFPGFIEAVPAIASTTIFFKLIEARKIGSGNTAFDAVKHLALAAVENLRPNEERTGKLISVPVSFHPDEALDLDAIASRSGCKPDEVIEIFLATEYRVFMLGFLPGFPYMGLVDERIAIPRRSTPRTSVPKGSIGIAGRQTGIYPTESPGGWQIIGRGDVDLFNPENDPPSLFSPGDRVRFTRAQP